MATDLEMAFNAIRAKSFPQTWQWRYYRGDQPLVYANERLREMFHGVQVKFTENWCAVVIDSIKDRIELTGFTSQDERVQATLDSIFQENELAIESDDLHECAIVTAEAYLIVGEDGAVYFNDSRLCQAFYQNDNPREMRFAAKLWTGDDGYFRMTLYYPDRFEEYKSNRKASEVDSESGDPKNWVIYDPDEIMSLSNPDREPQNVRPNPWGQIPVFHFTTKRIVLDDVDLNGEIADVIPIQNAVNKLLTDMLVVAEFGAFPQRYIISNVDTAQLKNSPNEIWQIPSGDGMGQGTAVGQFSAADLNNYLGAVEKLSSDIGRITRIPRQYFYGQGGDPSGEALVAMEAPLNKRCSKLIERFSSTWRKAMAFALKVQGVEVDANTITPIFTEPQTVQPMTTAQIRLTSTQAGMPLDTVLRGEGWTQAELDQMHQDQEATSETLGEKMLGAFERGK